MKHGKNYLIELNLAPTIAPKEGGWAQIKYANGKSAAVSPVVSTTTAWAKSVHVYALQDGADPALNTDQLSYRDAHGTGESRTITSFSALD
jgi:hypothetical protein